MDHRDDHLVPVERRHGVQAHLAKIVECERLGSELASCSTTESVMVALALCDRDFLAPNLASEAGRDLWRRLDQNQKDAVALFGRRAS